MKYQLLILAIVLIAPFFISAEVVIENSGSVHSVTSSSVSTGGNSVGSGGSVTTGNASASSKSEVTSGSGGSNVKIETTTSVNGEMVTKTVEKNLKAGEPVSVEVYSEAESGKKAESSIVVNGEPIEASNVATVTEESIVRSEPKSDNVFVRVAAKITVSLRDFFSMFKFW